MSICFKDKNLNILHVYKKNFKRKDAYEKIML